MPSIIRCNFKVDIWKISGRLSWDKSADVVGSISRRNLKFAERYLNALSTSNLQDDDQHHRTEQLVAAALADLSGGSGELFGSMLLRAHIAGMPRQPVESAARALAVLLRV